MKDSQFNVERATNGLVLALYLAAAIFLAVMLFYVLRDINERQAAAEESAAAVPVAPALERGTAPASSAPSYHRTVLRA